MLDQKEFGHAHLYFLLAVWFQWERGEALLHVIIMRHVFDDTHGEVRCEECQESVNMRATMVIFVLMATEIYLRDLGLVAATVGARRQHRGVPSLILQGENPRSGLNWLCLAMTLLNELFYEQGLSPG